MLSSSRFFFISLFVLAVGAGTFATRTLSRIQSDASRVKSVEDYWAETGLGPAPLEDLLQDQTCASSERYFLACANAILSVANRYNLSLSAQGHLVPAAQAFSKNVSSEKNQLQPWKDLYRNHKEAALKISFLELWQRLSQDFIQSPQKSMMVGLGLNGFISVFKDPHTYLMPVSQFQEVVAKADSRSTSLGLVLGTLNGKYVVRKVLEGSPAAQAKIKKGDVLLKINDLSTSGMIHARVSELLRGQVGDESTLQLAREGQAITYVLRRTEITVATVSTRFIDGIKPIAVIGINKFAKGACEKVKESLQTLNRSHVRGLLLDLRDNPGGQMEEAACVASLFVGPEKRIFEIRNLQDRKKSEVYFGGEEQIFDKPLAILINASSASAAEIVAGALRDFQRAVLVGEKTFGKGSFQEGEYWSQNKKIALFETKGFYYLPSGRSPQMKGLEPDVAVKFDNIQVAREADQFMSPLHAPEKSSGAKQLAATKPGMGLNAEETCLDSEEDMESEDLQLARARQILFCASTVAGAGI